MGRTGHPAAALGQLPLVRRRDRLCTAGPDWDHAGNPVRGNAIEAKRLEPIPGDLP